MAGIDCNGSLPKCLPSCNTKTALITAIVVGQIMLLTTVGIMSYLAKHKGVSSMNPKVFNAVNIASGGLLLISALVGLGVVACKYAQSDKKKLALGLTGVCAVAFILFGIYGSGNISLSSIALSRKLPIHELYKIKSMAFTGMLIITASILGVGGLGYIYHKCTK